MKINFQCGSCRGIFDSDVGEITFPPEADRPHFEHSPVCPNCGERPLNQVELTELGQGQLTEAFMNS